jgi:hypothetical protein
MGRKKEKFTKDEILFLKQNPDFVIKIHELNNENKDLKHFQFKSSDNILGISKVREIFCVNKLFTKTTNVEYVITVFTKENSTKDIPFCSFSSSVVESPEENCKVLSFLFMERISYALYSDALKIVPIPNKNKVVKDKALEKYETGRISWDPPVFGFKIVTFYHDTKISSIFLDTDKPKNKTKNEEKTNN